MKVVRIKQNSSDRVRKNLLDSVLKLYSIDKHQQEFLQNILTDLDLSDEDFIQFVLQIYKLSNTGRYSLSYELDLFSHLKARRGKRIKKLIKLAGSREAWPELYDNPYLSEEEIKTIEQMNRREYYSMLNTLENARSGYNFDQIIPCQYEKKVHFDGEEITTLYSKCYDNICLEQKYQTGKIVALNSKVPEIVYLADGSRENSYCFKTINLIKQLAREDFVNPKTGQLFSEILLSQLIMKYEKEIKMYKRYLELLFEVMK